MHNHYVPLISCSLHSTGSLKSFTKAFFKSSLPEKKNIKLNMNTSEKFAVVESFGSSLIVSHNYFIFWDLEMLENLFLNLNLGVPISCLGEPSVFTTTFASNSDLSSSSLENPNERISEEISVNKLEELPQTYSLHVEIHNGGFWDSFTQTKITQR